jgi:hypothetical protein
MMRNVFLCLFALGCAGDPAPATPAPEAAKAEAGATESTAAVATEAGAAAPAGAWTTYGAEPTIASAIPASEFLASPDKYVDQTVRVEGRVADVCQKAGCWMVIADGDKTMRIRMKDHAFSVDKQGAGGSCDIEGKVIAKAIDPKDVEHFASEQTAGAPLPEAGKSGTIYEIEAVSVRMKR